MSYDAFAYGRDAVLARFGLTKVAADFLASADPMTQLRRKGNISQQWDNLWKLGELAPAGKLPVMPAPPAPRPQTAAQPATKFAPKLPAAPKLQLPTLTAPPVAAPRPVVLPRPALSPPQQITSQTQGIAPGLKLGDWSLRPKPKLPPGKIHPDNGEHTLGNNFSLLGKGQVNPSIRQAFDALRAQHNSDASDPITLNAPNEMLIPTLGV